MPIALFSVIWILFLSRFGDFNFYHKAKKWDYMVLSVNFILVKVKLKMFRLEGKNVKEMNKFFPLSVELSNLTWALSL